MAFLFHIWAMNFVCFNGDMIPAHQPLFSAHNRGFKYGDGVFETIKVCQGKIPLAALHFKRLFQSLELLGIQPAFTEEMLYDCIIALSRENDCPDLARARLAVYRAEDNTASFVIEAVSLAGEVNEFNKKGLAIGLYPYARKSNDAFSNLKTANFLPYVMAGLYAKEKVLDDCLVLNCDNQIADASKANVFLVKGKQVYTPALHCGCVNGVMRRFLIDGFKRMDIQVLEQELCEIDLFDADEVFLTNAIYGMRWVQSFKQKAYSNAFSEAAYEQLVLPRFK